MEEIKVGEYVRTNKGRIQKIKYFSDFVKKIDENGNILDYEYVFHTGYPLFHIETEKIVKHSPEIIDLIEEGDYVNGYKVIFNLDKSKKIYDTTDNFITCVDYTFDEDEIKSIVTKEQFKSMEYRIEED